VDWSAPRLTSLCLCATIPGMTYQAMGETKLDTTEQKDIAQELAALLGQHRDEIAAAWAEKVHQLPDSQYRELPLEDLLVSTRRGLGAMLEALDTGDYAALETYLADVCVTRLLMGFDAAEVTEALLLCKDAALPVIRRAYPSDSTAAWASNSQLDACQRRMIGHFSQLYVAETSRLLEEQQARTALMLDMAQTAGSTLDLDEVLRRAAEGIATAAGVGHCGFYLYDEERGLLLPQLGTNRLPTPTAVRAFLNRPIDPKTNAFYRKVLERKEPLTCCDAQTDPRVDKEAARSLGVKSRLAVPLMVKGRVHAVAVVGTFDDYHTFTEEQIELAWGVANSAALAIENARLHQQVRHLAALEERDRLAREMHDGLAQAIGALNLKVSLAEALLSSGQLTQANLLELKQVAREAYTDVREKIFSLRIPASSGLEFFPMLQEYLTEYRTHYGVDARLVIAHDSLPEFPADVRVQIIRIIQEALTNVRKHAGAARAWVRFERDGDRVRISVEDDGRGFDPAQVEGEGRRSFGLEIMRERAESVGGDLALDSRPGQGTRVVIPLPLAREG